MSIQFDFSDRVVVVTGASGSLGTATVERFHAAGATVCLNARHPPDADATAIPLDADRVHFYGGDFTDDADAKRVVEAVIDDHDRIDIVATLIGAWRGGTTLDRTDTGEFDFLVAVNLKTMFLAAKHTVPHLRDSAGALVSVSARTALRGGAGDGPYRAAKAGVRLLTESIAEENRGRLRANAIMPSIIDTPANREMLPDADHDGWPTPDEIARVIQFLCSDAAGVTSGAAIPVYGDF